MLIWLNGPFGGGKTQTAAELLRRLPGSLVCDPEQVGFGLQRMAPRGAMADFQDLAAWRQGVFEVLDLAVRRHPGPVIVPMTLVDPGYFDEVVGRLRRTGHDVKHFALLAERETVLRRLRERGLGHLLTAVGGRGSLRRESFAVRRLDDCLRQLSGSGFEQHLWTDTVPIARVAEQIAGACGLSPLADADSRCLEWIRRAAVGIRHIRLR